MAYVPGSHHGPVRPHARSQVLGFSQGITDYGPDDVAREVAIHLEPGDVAAHRGNLIRSAGENVAHAPSRTFAIVFRGGRCHRDEEAFARYQAAVQRQQAELAASES